jgi:nucleoside-diphosphate-sugar epimerase
MPRDVFVTGGTGYIGQRLIPALLDRGHRVRALVRHASLHRVPARAETIPGDALDSSGISRHLREHDTLVHLVGTPRPSPVKAAEFRRVDLPSIRASVAAAVSVRLAHLVYVSVAHPAPVMRAYIDVRSAGEAAIEAAGLTATIVRPWYVLGPGHRWPMTLLPIYGILSLVPATREGAQRLGFVTLDEMIAALVAAVESPPARGTRRIVEVPAIRQAARAVPQLQKSDQV